MSEDKDNKPKASNDEDVGSDDDDDDIWTASPERRQSPTGEVDEFVLRSSTDGGSIASGVVEGTWRGHKLSGEESKEPKEEEKKEAQQKPKDPEKPPAPAPKKTPDLRQAGHLRHSKTSGTSGERKRNRLSGPTRRATKYHMAGYSGGGDNPSILMDWYNAAGWGRFAAFDLEIWWRRSSMAQRINFGMVLLCLAIFLVNVTFGIYMIYTSFSHQHSKSPYLCDSEDCKKASVYMSSTMNFSVDPCDNFFEFVCGNYPNEVGKRRGNQFSTVLKGPSFPVAFGESSILASILRDYKNDPQHDQSVRYYRACLNLENRKKFGLEAFLEVVEYVFGTRDFTKFEGMKVSMEEIGSRMFQVVGHASFVNMAFYTYPYIQILRPSGLATRIYFAKTTPRGTPWANGVFVQRVMEGLLRELKVAKNSELETEIIIGINLMGSIVADFYREFNSTILDKDLDTVLNDPEFRRIVIDKDEEGTLCPPFGIQLDMEKILQLFIKDPFRVDFIDLMAVKWHAAFKLCFEQPVASFTAKKFSNPKTAFVGLWLLDLFWDYHLSMDSAEMMNAWNLSDPIFTYNDIIYERSNEVVDVHEEFMCLVSLYRNLGYMPSIRYLLSITDNPAELIGQIEDEITAVFGKVSSLFTRIPKTEVDTITAHLGHINFARGIYVDVGVPLVNGILDETTIDDLLNFTDDHLRNSIIATRYTIENARQNWMGSVDSEAIIQWWGSGGPSDIRSELLDLREPMHQPARYVEKLNTREGNGTWETFLGRGHPNYVLYPLSLIGEPHVDETMALYYAGYRQKIIRSLLALPEHQFRHDRYPSLLNDFWHEGDPKRDNGANRTCQILYDGTFQNYDRLYFTYTTVPYDNFRFSFNSEENYNTLLAVREALLQFREDRKVLRKAPFNWTLPQKERDLRMQRQLPGKMKKFSEEQLYFITWVRHACRGSWKTHKDSLQYRRWILETEILYVLMHLEEFGKAWGCDRNSFMNNLGLPRCMRWEMEG